MELCCESTTQRKKQNKTQVSCRGSCFENLMPHTVLLSRLQGERANYLDALPQCSSPKQFKQPSPDTYLNQYKQASPINGEIQLSVSAGKPRAGRPRVVIHQAGHDKANANSKMCISLECCYQHSKQDYKTITSILQTTRKIAKGGSKKEIIINTPVKSLQ